MVTKNGTKLYYKDRDILNSIFQIKVQTKLKLESTKSIEEISDSVNLKESYIEEAIKRLRRAGIIIVKIKKGKKVFELTKYGYKVLVKLNRVGKWN